MQEQRPRRNRKAVASLVLGCLAVVLPISAAITIMAGRQAMARVADPLVAALLFVCLPASLAAPILALLALREIRAAQGRQRGARGAGAGLLLGCAGLSVPLLLAASAVPYLFRDRIPENEAKTYGAMRDLSIGAENFWEDHAFYPARLEDFAQPNVRISSGVQGLLLSGECCGYRFTYTSTDTDGDGSRDAFTINADPTWPGRTGRRHFFVDQTGNIRVETSGPATRHSPLAH